MDTCIHFSVDYILNIAPRERKRAVYRDKRNLIH